MACTINFCVYLLLFLTVILLFESHGKLIAVTKSAFVLDLYKRISNEEGPESDHANEDARFRESICEEITSSEYFSIRQGLLAVDMKSIPKELYTSEPDIFRRIYLTLPATGSDDPATSEIYEYTNSFEPQTFTLEDYDDGESVLAFSEYVFACFLRATFDNNKIYTFYVTKGYNVVGNPYKMGRFIFADPRTTRHQKYTVLLLAEEPAEAHSETNFKVEIEYLRGGEKVAKKPPILYCTRSKFKLFLEQSMPILSEAYWPTFWCVDGRLQTALQLFCRIDRYVPYEREIFELDDGGQVALDWVHTKTDNSDAPIILLFPGITGHSGDTYIKKLAISVHECGFRCLVFNYRGRGDIELKTPKLYSLNDTTDSLQVVRHIKKRFPTAVVGACGISMGAMQLAHYLIKHSSQKEISFAMMNYTFFDLFDASDKMNGIITSCFNKVLVYDLRQTVARYRHILDIEEAPWNVPEVLKTRTIQEFDEKFTSKMFGYNSVHEYYREANLMDKMDKINVPVLCLNAADDPGQPLKYPEHDDRLFFDNDKVVVIVTARGGHMSHLEGVWPMTSEKSNFMLRTFVQYFTAMFHDESYKLFTPNDSKDDL